MDQPALTPEDFTRIVEENQRPVFNLCYRMLGDANEAEDAAQETFWRAYKNFHRYDPQRPFLTWLLSIAAHYCIDEIRKRRMKVISIDLFPEETLPDNGELPEKSAVLVSEKADIQKLLDTLSPEDRVAVVMRYWNELPETEIAGMLGLTVSAVKSRLFRARKQLALEWARRQGLEPGEQRRRHEPSVV